MKRWKHPLVLEASEPGTAQGHGLSDSCKHGSKSLLALLRTADSCVISEQANDAIQRGASSERQLTVVV